MTSNSNNGIIPLIIVRHEDGVGARSGTSIKISRMTPFDQPNPVWIGYSPPAPGEPEITFIFSNIWPYSKRVNTKLDDFKRSQVEIGRSLNIRAKVRTKVDRLIKLDGSLTKRRRPKSAEAKVLLDFTLDDTFICVVVHIEPFFCLISTFYHFFSTTL